MCSTSRFLHRGAGVVVLPLDDPAVLQPDHGVTHGGDLAVVSDDAQRRAGLGVDPGEKLQDID